MSVTLQRRSRSIVTFGQFGGSACQESLGDWEKCTPTEPCVQTPRAVCPETDFQCESGTSATRANRWSRVISGVTPLPVAGTCIRRRFYCNGDLDCEDGSDEACDEDPLHKPCGATELQSDEQGRTAGYG